MAPPGIGKIRLKRFFEERCHAAEFLSIIGAVSSSLRMKIERWGGPMA